MPHPQHSLRSPAFDAVWNPLSHTGTFIAMAVLVLVGDLVSKLLAVGLWTGEKYSLIDGHLLIQVVRNPLGAFSTSLGAYTYEINFAATVAAVLLTMAVSSRLAQLDAIAPRALGLIAGAALGNLASLTASPTGVPDFLAIAHDRGALVVNLADVAAYLGIACCLRVAWSVMRALARRRVAIT